MNNTLYNQQMKKVFFPVSFFLLKDAPLEYHAGVHIETLQTQTQAMLREHLIFDSLKFGKILLLIGDLRNVKKKTIQRVYFGENSQNFDALFGLIVAEVFRPQATYYRNFWFPVLEFHFSLPSTERCVFISHLNCFVCAHSLRFTTFIDSGPNVSLYFNMLFLHWWIASKSLDTAQIFCFLYLFMNDSKFFSKLQFVYLTFERLSDLTRETFAPVWSLSELFTLTNLVMKWLKKIWSENTQKRRPRGSSIEHGENWPAKFGQMCLPQIFQVYRLNLSQL